MNIHLRKTEWEWREYFHLLKKKLKTFFFNSLEGWGGGGVVGGLGATTQKKQRTSISREQSGQDLDSPLKEVI